MKSIILQGHSRPIKEVKFNHDGSLLITGSSDRNIIIWSTATGKKTAIFGHGAAVNSFTISKDEQYLFSSDMTGTIYFWEIKSCRIVRKIEYDVTMTVKSMEVSDNGEDLMICLSGRTKTSKSIIDVLNIKDVLKMTADPIFEKFKPKSRFESTESKFSKTKIIKNIYEDDGSSSQNAGILAAREDGKLQIINYTTGETVKNISIHKDVIMDFDYDNKSSLLLTVSKDGKAVITDLKNNVTMNSFTAENPKRQLNVCRFSPNVANICREEVDETLLKFHCIFAGGQDSKNVTTTHKKEGGFEVILYDLLDDKDVGNVGGHFGPVNAICISPDGKNIVSGGEDSTVRIVNINDINVL
jgi:translation initiation factor 3 subunit I